MPCIIVKLQYLVTLIEDKMLLLFCVLNNKLGGVDGYRGGWRPL